MRWRAVLWCWYEGWAGVVVHGCRPVSVRCSGLCAAQGLCAGGPASFGLLYGTPYICCCWLPAPAVQSQGFVEDGKLRTIPLEVMVKGDKVPVYEETLEENGR